MSRAFDVAVFYGVSPREVYALTLDDFLTWEREGWRIVRERDGDDG